MIIHSTFTDGYFNFSKLFLKSFKCSNGDGFKIVFTTTDLTKKQIYELKNIYHNLSIHNYTFDYSKICKELNISEVIAKELKYQVEHKNAKLNSMGKNWKMHVAAEKRVKQDIPFVMKYYKDENLIAHFDIDMYFKKSLSDLFYIMNQHDFTVMYRPYLNEEYRKIWICTMGIKTNNKNVDIFIREWGNELDKIPLKDKPYSYGQTSCYRVYKRFLKNKKINFGNIDANYIVTGITGKEDAYIVSGNSSSVGKDNSLNLFKNDFKMEYSYNEK